MKKILPLLLGAFICCSTTAQPAAENIGTKTLYTAPVAKLTPPPAGYEPVFINHVGRHGARHLTKPVATAKGYMLLRQAAATNALTPTGQRLYISLQRLDNLEQKDIKSISAEGVAEQQEIAARMYRQNEALFQHHTNAWEVVITKEIRTQQTAMAFINELKKRASSEDSIIYTVNDTTLRFYDMAPAYNSFEEHGSWKQQVAQLKQKWSYNAIVNSFCKSIFSADYLQQLTAAQKEDFTTDVYGFYTILLSLKKEARDAGLQISADSIKPFFTQQQLSLLGIADRAEDYFVKGPGVNEMGIPVKIAAPLLADFLNTTEAFIQSGKKPVQLRFSHAETIIPFAALLQLQGANKAVKSNESFSDAVWNAAQIAPLSANIQWTVYTSKTSGKYLVKILLNEKEMRIDGLATKQFPYYGWQSVKAFYLGKLQQLHFNLLDNNGYRYLQELQ